MRQLPKTGKLFIPRTTRLLKKLKKYWKEYKEIEQEYHHSMAKLENKMQKELKEELLEFFFVDNECVGIGTPANPDKMKLIRREHLE